MKNSLSLIVQKLLSKNKITHDKKELAFQIESHPSYPSLHAITGVLDHFNIENIAAEVPVNSETLAQLPDSFIAQTTTDKGNDLVTVSRIKNKSSYKLFSGDEKNNTITEDEFLKQFTGIIVAVEKTDQPVEKMDDGNIKNILLLSLFSVTLLLLYINNETTLFNYIFSILSIIGGIASYSILKQELGQSTAIGNAFCSGNNDKKDCDAVLNSKGAEVIKGHKLSDLSIIYFSSLTIASFFLSNINPLLIISLLALPITIYSIYYQYKIVKTWCMLCLSIVGVLWLQAAIVFLINGDFTTLLNLTPKDILITTASFLAIYLAWSYIKPLINNVIQLHKDKIASVKFKRNFNLFNNLLQKSSTLNTNIQNSKEIVLGNKNSNLEIIVITNPFCGHCKPVHKIINDVLKKYSNLVKIIIRFNVPTNDSENNSVVVTNKLLELYNEADINTFENAIDEIYDGMKYDTWVSKWGKVKNINTYLTILEKQKQWCNDNAINFTPEILINGKSFPKEYDRVDLVFFIEDMEENLKTTPQFTNL